MKKYGPAPYRVVVLHGGPGAVGEMAPWRSYNALPEDEMYESVGCDMAIFQGIWPEAAKLRSSGELLALGKQIRCPVLAIHGDYDPGPATGGEKPLESVLREFKFLLLDRCGHTPWREKYACERFYKMLKEEIM